MAGSLAALLSNCKSAIHSLKLPGFFAVSLLACASIMVRAQTVTTINGVVTDPGKLAVPGAVVTLLGQDIVITRSVTTDAHGVYRLAALPAGNYKLTVSREGFATEVLDKVTVLLDRTVELDVTLKVGSTSEQVEVTGQAPLLDITTPATGLTIDPEKIHDIPLNGRNYLDLLQLVPGVSISRQSDPNSDTAVTILGERSNNTGYLIDGLNNSDELNGGPFAQFNMDTIGEFEVLTSGYKAEFGHASGGVVNVVTRTGSNETHGLASVYLRDNVLDSSDLPNTSVPYLLRWDYDVAAGGSIVKDKVFWFGSAENIHQNEALNFTSPAGVPAALIASENAYGTPSRDHEVRTFGKLSETVQGGRQSLAEEFNYTNVHISNFLPLSQSLALPSARGNQGYTAFLAGATDTILLGRLENPTIVSAYAQFRNEPSTVGPAHPQAGPLTTFYIFSGLNTGGVIGDVGAASYGARATQGLLQQKYGDTGVSLTKTYKRNTFKLGYQYMRTQVDGVEQAVQSSQLFATLSDYSTYGPVNSGFSILLNEGASTPADNSIQLRNNYSGLYFQDDYKLLSNLVVNAGLRWDYDSAFKAKKDFAPRVGFSWSPDAKTVVRGSFGLFFDHFRLGIARDIPGFGGANLAVSNPFVYPRLFYGVPTIVPDLFGLCLSPSQTDAQLAATKATCPASLGGGTIYGVDHLNNVVAAGHAPIPANSVVTQADVQQLSGLDPSTYLNNAAIAIGHQPGYLYFGPTGALSYLVNPAAGFPVTIDPSFATPFTRAFTLGVQRQISNDFVIALDLYHKGIENILGVRQTNIPFDARLGGKAPSTAVNGYGPWFSGKYDSAILSFEKRYSHRYTAGGSYAWTSANDDAFCANVLQGPSQVGGCYPTDSFVGQTTAVTDPKIGKTNASGGFFASNGNFVPPAGVFWNGPKLDQGPSDFALRHVFQLHGMVQVPFKIQLSGLFRAQSGFRYTQSSSHPIDQDGNGNLAPRDLLTGRNAFTSPMFVNQDVRITRTFTVHDRIKIEPIFEYFNLFNNANPAAIQTQQTTTATGPFGTISQRLPGRQGQAALRVEF